MKKSVAVLTLLSSLFIFVQVLQGQTRPRRVGQSSGTPQTPPASSQGTPVPAPPARPPVLGGATTNNKGQSTGSQTSAPQNDEPEMVGEGDVVRVSTTLVTIPVSVLDRNGKYIPNLRKQDFRIYEDGVEHEVAYFASVEKPFTVALVIDTSGSTRFRLDEIQDAAMAFVNQLRADDRVLVVSFDDQVRVLSEATSDRYELRDAIRRTRPGDGTRLYDAIDFVINQRFNRIQGRKAIVLFTDGVDTTSKRASYQSTVRDAEELDALIYPVQYDTYDDMQGGGSSGPIYNPLPNIIFRWPFPFPMPRTGGRRGGGGGTGTSRADYSRADAYLQDLSTKTGARLYRASDLNNLNQSFALVAEELRRQYSLGYYPKSPGQVGQRRQIRVRVNRPELAVRARDSYIVGASSNATAQDEQRQAPVLRTNKLTPRNGSGRPASR